MKISRLQLDGFRCFRGQRALELPGGRSLCLLAENGKGKTSIADALEYWSLGDVHWTRREGVGLRSLVHLDRDEAIVDVRVEGAGMAKRRLRGNKPAALEPTGPLAVDFTGERLPILRYRTMAEFVDKSANDKRSELLEALGLDDLAAFRTGVRSARNKLRRFEKEAKQQLEAADDAWTAQLGSESASSVLDRLSREAQLDERLDSEDALADWEPPAAVPMQESSLLAQAEELSAARKAFQDAPKELWEKAVGDRATAESRGLSTLLEAGQQVLGQSDEDHCPLCLVDQDRAALLQRVSERAAELAAVTKEFEAAERQLAEHEFAGQRLVRAIRAVLAAKVDLVPDLVEDLSRAQASMGGYLDNLHDARQQRLAAPPAPSPLPETMTTLVREASLTAPSQVGPALLELSKLKSLATARRKAAQTAQAAERKLTSIEAAAEIANEVVEETIQQALDRINDPLARYYGELVGRSIYSGLRLTYTHSRAGGIEFKFSWDNRHEVSPPQCVMSESELNALGLALFLARLRTDPSAWRTMVLDDVVASFDAVHRTRLIRLLKAEFADWQIVLLTHDHQLARNVTAEAPEWLLKKVIAWSDAEGPSFGSGEMRARLRERLDAGEPAQELGGLARQAVEEALERPIRKLGLRIRHDPTNGYTADEYRRTLITGLKEGNFQRADADVLTQLGTDGSITNRACHFDKHEAGVTADDLQLLLDDLDTLDQLFRCDGCGKKVWQVPHQGSTRYQCSCGTLSCTG